MSKREQEPERERDKETETVTGRKREEGGELKKELWESERARLRENGRQGGVSGICR